MYMVVLGKETLKRSRNAQDNFACGHDNLASLWTRRTCCSVVSKLIRRYGSPTVGSIHESPGTLFPHDVLAAGVKKAFVKLQAANSVLFD
jgi:hypothetical protein